MELSDLLILEACETEDEDEDEEEEEEDDYEDDEETEEEDEEEDVDDEHESRHKYQQEYSDIQALLSLLLPLRNNLWVLKQMDAIMLRLGSKNNSDAGTRRRRSKSDQEANSWLKGYS